MSHVGGGNSSEDLQGLLMPPVGGGNSSEDLQGCVNVTWEVGTVLKTFRDC